MDGEGAERRKRRKSGWDEVDEEHASGASFSPAQSGAFHTVAKTPGAPPISADAVNAAMPGDALALFPTKDTTFIKKLCKFWGWGSCQRAFDCPFAHGVDELNREGLSQESNLQIIIEAEKDAASKGETGQKLLMMLSAEKAKFAAAQEKLAVERQMHPQHRQDPRPKGRGDFANKLMLEELEKKIEQMKTIRGLEQLGGYSGPAQLMDDFSMSGSNGNGYAVPAAGAGAMGGSMPGSAGAWAQGAAGAGGAGAGGQSWDGSWGGGQQGWQNGGGGNQGAEDNSWSKDWSGGKDWGGGGGGGQSWSGGGGDWSSSWSTTEWTSPKGKGGAGKGGW